MGLVSDPIASYYKDNAYQELYTSVPSEGERNVTETTVAIA